MMRIAVVSLTIVFCLGIGHANAQNISDEALRHFDRGMAAVERAKTPADYEDAIKEFKKAVKLAPGWADAYYNLGFIQEKLGKYADAFRNLTKYVELSPDASDVREVKKFIAKIEYRLPIGFNVLAVEEGGSFAVKLRELAALKKDGLISDDEYRKKRAGIMREK